MIWEKKGLIYAVTGELWWARQYAGMPTPEIIDDERIRIYFFSCEENFDGRIGYVDVDIDDPGKILDISKEPVLDIGRPGLFDDCGVLPSCIINVEGKKYFYYVGVQRSEKVPYLYYAGLAISEGNQPFKKYSTVPLLERTELGPFIRSATTIIHDEGKFKMWYVSGADWIEVNGKMQPTYIIRHSESTDGIRWSENNHACIDFKNDDENGFGRPWVIKEDGIYKLWYSIRSMSEPYKIGYAESSDGINFTRKDEEAGIAKSPEGWDSEMICYPAIIAAKGKTYLFHNGNRHGYTGFGYAVLKEG